MGKKNNAVTEEMLYNAMLALTDALTTYGGKANVSGKKKAATQSSSKSTKSTKSTKQSTKKKSSKKTSDFDRDLYDEIAEKAGCLSKNGTCWKPFRDDVYDIMKLPAKKREEAIEALKEKVEDYEW